MMKGSKLLLLCCGGLLFASGCVLPGEGSRVVTIRPDKRAIDFEQEFQEAYAMPAEDGGYDLLMAAGMLSKSPSYGSKLYPSAVRPVSEVVRIHVAWRPARMVRSDFPAAANSTVDWYVFDNRVDGACSQYQGVGYVATDLGGNQTLFHLRDVRVREIASAPSLRDPIGPSRLSGTIRAENNAPRAKELLNEVERRLQRPATMPVAAPASEPAGMPPARVVGP